MEKYILKVKSFENGGDINVALKANVGLKISSKTMAHTNDDAIIKMKNSLSVRNDKLAKILNSKTFQPLYIDGSSPSSGTSSNICDDENVQPQPNTFEGTTNRLLNGMENLTPPSSASHISAMIVNPRTPQNHHMLARLQRDLDSPSAATRIRAMRALKSPANGPYNQFDVPHEEQDIITEEERRDVIPKTIQDVMKDVIVYVEARFGDDNRTASIKGAMAELGATVNDNFNKNTTHVIFSNGTQSTYNKAKQLNIPIVSILWIEACKKQLRLVDPAKYSIHNLEQYENPELYKRPKVKKFFQTESELKIKKRKHTPIIQKFKSIKIPKKAKDNLTGMLNEFRERQANTSSGIDYFSENFKVVDLFNDTKITGDRRKTSSTKRSLFSDAAASTSRKDEVSPTLQSNKTNKSPPKSNATTALAKPPQASNVESPAIFKTPSNRKTILASSSDVQHSANSLVRVTRRTSMLALASPSVDNTPIQRNQKGIPAEITEITSNDNLTKNTSEPMEITPNGEKSPRIISNRRTNVNSSEMDFTNPQPTVSSTRKRNSMIPMRFKDFEVDTKKYLVKSSPINSEKTNRRRTMFTPNDAASSSTAVSTLQKEDEARISQPNSRRTLFAINQTSSNAIAGLNQNHEEQASTSNVNQSVFAPNEASSPLVPKKTVASLRRSLFKPPIATLSPLAITALTKLDDTQKSNTKRRRTLLPPPSPSPLVVSTLNKVGEKEDTPANRRRTVFTTSHANPIMPTNSPLNNGTAKGSSRRRTCFATSQASDNLNNSQDVRNNGVGTPPSGETGRNKTLSGDYLTPQSHTLFEEYSQRLTFSSTNKRHTVRDISLHIIEQRLKNINEIARMNRSVSESDVNNDAIDKSLSERVATSSPQLRPTEKATDNEVESLPPPPKKRRLFDPTAYEEQVAMKSTETSDNNNTPTKASADKAMIQKTKLRDTTHHSKQKQRRSTMEFKTEPPKPVKVYASIMKTNSPMNYLAYTNLNQDQINVINEAITTMGKFTVEPNVTKKTTHLVTFDSKRTQKFLRAIIRGLWILDYKWVTESLQAGVWLYEEPYENRSVSNAVSMCRAEAQAFGSKYKIEIFSHLDPIYISTKGKCPALKELYTMCGGRVTNSRSDAKYIVADKFKKSVNQVCLHSDWILDSITAANCKNPSIYKLMSV